MHIQLIDEEKARGECAEVYGEYMREMERDFVPDILKCFGHHPAFLRHIWEASRVVHFTPGALTRQQKEMIATFVSGLNACPY